MFSFSLRMCFCSFFVHEGSSSSNTTTNRNTATTTYYLKQQVHTAVRSTSVSTRGRQRKQARMKRASQVLPSAGHVRVFYVSYFPRSLLVVPSSFTIRKANRQQLIWIFPGTADTQPCGGPPARLYHIFLVWISV